MAICTSARYNREWSSGDDDEGSMRKGSNEADLKKKKNCLLCILNSEWTAVKSEQCTLAETPPTHGGWRGCLQDGDLLIWTSVGSEGKHWPSSQRQTASATSPALQQPPFLCSRQRPLVAVCTKAAVCHNVGREPQNLSGWRAGWRAGWLTERHWQCCRALTLPPVTLTSSF